jgi:hypothetical protein
VYAVHYIRDDELPAKQAWVMVRTGTRVALFIKESKVCPRVLEEAWAGFREIEPRAMPEQRQPAKVLALRG